jgi:hypothetical protein
LRKGFLQKFGTALLLAALLAVLLVVLLAGCADQSTPQPTEGPLSTPLSGDSIAAATATALPPSPTPQPTRTPTPTTEIIALVPTNTPPVIFPTPTDPPAATPTPRADQSIPIQGPSLITFRSTRLSFQTAYAKAAAQMNTVSGAARLVLGQATTFTLDQTVWTFFFTIPNGTSTWAVTIDSGAKDQKEQVTVVRSVTLLPDEAGQWQPSKILDSDELTTRLQRNGLPPQLPFDTVYVQMQSSPTQGKVPAYLLVNSALQKELIVSALDATIIRNDFQ